MLCLYNLTHFLNSTLSGSPPGPGTQKEREREGGNKTVCTHIHRCIFALIEVTWQNWGRILLNWPAFSWQSFKRYLEWRFKPFNKVSMTYHTFEPYILFSFPPFLTFLIIFLFPFPLDLPTFSVPSVFPFSFVFSFPFPFSFPIFLLSFSHFVSCPSSSHCTAIRTGHFRSHEKRRQRMERDVNKF